MDGLFPLDLPAFINVMTNAKEIDSDPQEAVEIIANDKDGKETPVLWFSFQVANSDEQEVRYEQEQVQ